MKICFSHLLTAVVNNVLYFQVLSKNDCPTGYKETLLT